MLERQPQAQALAEETPEVPEALRGLTCREREVLALLAEGKTAPEIAEALCISTHSQHSRAQPPGQIGSEEPRAGRRAVGSLHAGKAAPMIGNQNWIKKYLILGMTIGVECATMDVTNHTKGG